MRALSKRHALSLLAMHNPVDPIDECRERTRGFYPDTELFVQPAFGCRGVPSGLRSWARSRAAQLGRHFTPE
jgi:hypothetical protein